MDNIPEEAVEAALDALLEVFQAGAFGGVYIQENSATDWVVDGIADLPLAVKKAVEDAAPYLIRAALRDVADDLDAGIVYGWDSDRQYAEYLRSRADEMRAK